MRKAIFAFIVFFALAGSFGAVTPHEEVDALEAGFHTPPDSAKPWAYWWWLNGNVTKEGITRDLEEMKRQGINGVLIFHAGEGKTPVGPKFLSPEWRELFRHALRELRRLGMEASVNLCDGWDSGGPWITKDEANKKLVYSELQVDGPQKLSRELPTPPTLDDYYHDVAVLAVPEKPRKPVTPANVTASSTLVGYGEWNFHPLDTVDGDPTTYWSSAATAPTLEKPISLDLDYSEPLEAHEIYLAPGPQSGPRDCELESSQDGKTFSSVQILKLKKAKPLRMAIAPTRAAHFRIKISSAYGTPVQIAEATLLRKGDEPQLRKGIKWWWFKSANRSFWDYPRQGPSALEEEYDGDAADFRTSDVRIITQQLNSSGRIAWDVPPGRWTILRFGYTLEGQRTRAQSANGDGGYEADMLSSAGIEKHFRVTAEPILADAEAVGGGVLKTFHIDSYELGADILGQQPTWSREFREEFEKRRGYDPLPYLPAMTRRIVESREVTNRFFWDMRHTVGDLMAEKFWRRYAELAHARGVKVAGETGYGTYPYPHIDGVFTAGQLDVPMGEFWVGTDVMSQFNPWGNVIRSVSAPAHIYGHPIVQAESFTAWTHWRESPAILKPIGDAAFVDGLNRMVFHQYTHQPEMEMKPGWQYFAGTHFDRSLTWWEQARAFFQYLARCQHLLQEGRFVADALYFYGEGVTKFVPSREYLRPALPRGYDFDALNADALLHRLSVRDGRLMLPDGMSYRVLVLPENGVMSVEVLKKIQELAQEGATVVGWKPQRAPGLKNYPRADAEVKKLADEMWGDCDGVRAKERKLGSGRILCGGPMSQALRVPPDFEYRAAEKTASLDFIHRRAGDADFYFVTNRQERATRAECTFRVRGRKPELWDPASGETRAAAAFTQSESGTTLPLEFAPNGSMFVVFRTPVEENAKGTAMRNFPTYSDVAELRGAWKVGFDPKWGGPASVEFKKLISWTARPEQGVKYYSGKATYHKTFDLPTSLAGEGRRVALDLGELRDVAEVRLNGKNLGILWTKPFRVEITGAAKPGGNMLEIDVVNLWANRVIGDAALPPEQRLTRTNIEPKPGESLLPSGLFGPVRLQSIE